MTGQIFSRTRHTKLNVYVSDSFCRGRTCTAYIISSSGHDGISNKVLKSIKNEIAKPLTLIINQMLKTGIFPNAFKKSKITPLFKMGYSLLVANYRPISLLPTMSKIFERMIHN